MEAVASPSALVPQGPGANGETPSAFITIDPKLVVDYLVSVVSITLGATRDDLESPGSLLSRRTTPIPSSDVPGSPQMPRSPCISRRKPRRPQIYRTVR